MYQLNVCSLPQFSYSFLVSLTALVDLVTSRFISSEIGFIKKIFGFSPNILKSTVLKRSREVFQNDVFFSHKTFAGRVEIGYPGQFHPSLTEC